MRRLITPFFAAILIAAFAAPAGAASGSQWHRINPSDPPAHERLTCAGTSVWQCRYDLVPEPARNFYWSRSTGRFTGSSAACPAELGDLCSHAVKTYVGATTYHWVDVPPFTLYEDLIVTDGQGGYAPLYMYFPGDLFCPWFRSFSDAYAANPFPLPYDGVNGPAPDCIHV